VVAAASAKRLELVLGRLGPRPRLERVEPFAHPPLRRGVQGIETEGYGLAVAHLVAHVVGQQILDLPLVRRTAGLLPVVRGQPMHERVVEDDPAPVLPPRGLAADGGREEQASQHEVVHERLANDPAEDGPHAYDPARSAAVCAIVQYAPSVPTTWAGSDSAQRGQGGSSSRSDHARARYRSTKASWPASTPRLKSRRARTRSWVESPRVRRPLAKARPCSRPNAKAASQGRSIVALVEPRRWRAISTPRNRMLRAM